MRRFALPALVLTFSACALSLLPAQQTAPAGGAAQAWEYRVIYAPDLYAGGDAAGGGPAKRAEGKFNEYGREGWEYVGTLRQTDYLFKRPKR